ncbi:MAG: hypothetical protein KF814_12935 [Nitrospiraceae bacterium]|nr:hypothetical protein [Nitrospiraceae bacterium]
MSEQAQLAEIRSVTTLTTHTRQLILRPIERPLSFQPGQWISLQLPIGDRPPLNRAYSLAAPPSDNGDLCLVFDHVPDGLASTYLCGLQPGARFPFSGPYGRFVLPELQGKRLLLLGRYSGLVPLRCMIRAMADRQNLPRTTLIAHAPSPDEHLYHEEFTALAKTNPNFTYEAVVNEPAGTLDGTLAKVRQLVNGDRACVPMIAGIRAFAHPLRELFLELGFDRKEVKLETYD